MADEKKILGSWKTSMAGIAMIILVVGQILAAISGEGIDGLNWTALIAEFMAGIGLLVARDNSKSSKSLGLEE